MQATPQKISSLWMGRDKENTSDRFVMDSGGSEWQGWLLITVGIILVSISVLGALNQLINFRKIPLYVTVSVYIGWFCCFGILLLLPLDVIMSLYTSCSKANGQQGSCTRPWVLLEDHELLILWRIVYWTAYILCWTAYPFLQAYVYTGDFRWVDKIKSALRAQLRYWLILLCVLTPFVIYLFAVQRIGGRQLIAAAMAAANVWGLFLFICFLGNGMVELPRSLWQKSNRSFRMKKLHFDLVAQKKSALVAARNRLDELIGEIKYYDHHVTANNNFHVRPQLEVVIQQCPKVEKELYVRMQERASSRLGREYYHLEHLVTLHQDLKLARDEVLRTKSIFDITLKRIFELEDITKSRGNSNMIIRWSFEKRRRILRRLHTNLRHLLEKAEYVWIVYLQPVAYKLFAFFCVVCSAVLLWTEVFFTVPKPDLSVFSLLISDHGRPYLFQWLFTAAPVAYIVYCTYWSLFRIQLFNYVRLLPDRHTDANSILWVTMYLCRMTAPIAYNYLLASRVDNTSYYLLMGKNVLFENYERFFPLVLIVVILINMFNLRTVFIHKFCFKSLHRYAFHEQISDDYIMQGMDIAAHEREIWERKRLEGSLTLSPMARTEDEEIRISIQDRDTPTTGILREPLRFPDFGKIFGTNREKKKYQLLSDDDDDRL
ncbi:LMBR1 domain-containing protein [Planoprotostelium fungivorum]|uniref:LMBR1 domain-containing protein n=1 Tax=Planoprotostelium fungivorum TaxID=1890364 RepID=A0A2P6NX96_9EUKA|nr:LMBR1 domain-containing protein [Planoprotostelium fungivorum]